jgi:RHH-type proline utilization regulon transcriptional repressor/proline dehydrogenase/delta 1-pyrroline-5-carboxylate dehydrogenase
MPDYESAEPSGTLDPLRLQIRQQSHADEEAVVRDLFVDAEGNCEPRLRTRVVQSARDLVDQCRSRAEQSGTLDAFLKEFGLSNPEGVALMCLAEALLRIPDDDTADRLIAEKIRSGDWAAHAGRSDSLFVNGSVWGLMLTGQLVTLEPDAEANPAVWVRRLVSRMGEPIVRTAVIQAMRILGRQYVLGRNIEEALARSRSSETPGELYSFDMLGEGARTWADADRYLDNYQIALTAVGTASRGEEPAGSNGISVKLSALHPRFEMAQHANVMGELPERVIALARLARHYGIGLTIDAEEAGRLDLTMDVFELLARSPELAGWDGLGFVLQAYQKRAPRVADWLIELAKQTNQRLMVRLVKGAYWDAEIKHAQELGLPDYPVFTRKSNTDLCYEICAARLLDAGSAIYPQFATHNALTATQALTLAKGRDFELQRLHGMGELLYECLAEEFPEFPLRVYAPVGSHEDLLPYLVRRLLENGANSSFVNRFLDQEVPPEQLIIDPLAASRRDGDEQLRHTGIPTPPDLYRSAGEQRDNAAGVDLDDPALASHLAQAQTERANRDWTASPSTLATADSRTSGVFIRAPANPDRVLGVSRDAEEADVLEAIRLAGIAQPAWDDAGGEQRADVLTRAAANLESATEDLLYLLGTEAGRTVPDAVSELREAADFCRYYAMQCRQLFKPVPLPGPTGESNTLSLHGRGVFACISPWNFPLAIFLGIAALATRLLHDAGVPEGVLQLLPGPGERIGACLTDSEGVNGIAFTGSIEVAQLINRQLAARPGPIVPFIAETGGQNVLIADSTALPEQLVDDVLTSAFRSAGQRCSALRVLYLQDDIADKVLNMLIGAMETLILGDPLSLTTDIGPVIDDAARAALSAHAEGLTRQGRLIANLALPDACQQGSFFPPHIFEIDSIAQLPGEVFGPILHVIRFDADRLEQVIDEINGTGFGLTLGVHSRIEGFAKEIFRRTHVGNTYVNRNMIGAVVGVQPFGGQGLSGTGPKAGGTNYLQRFAVERTYTDNVTARGGNAALFELEDRRPSVHRPSR